MIAVPEQTRIDFLGYRWYKALAKHIKPFGKKKHISARMSVPQLLEMSSSILLWKKTLLRYLLEDSDLN